MEAMERLMRGRTTFMIAHRLSTLERCDVQLHVEEGTLRVGRGTRALAPTRRVSMLDSGVTTPAPGFGSSSSGRSRRTRTPAWPGCTCRSPPACVASATTSTTSRRRRAGRTTRRGVRRSATPTTRCPTWSGSPRASASATAGRTAAATPTARGSGSRRGAGRGAARGRRRGLQRHRLDEPSADDGLEDRPPRLLRHRPRLHEVDVRAAAWTTPCALLSDATTRSSRTARTSAPPSARCRRCRGSGARTRQPVLLDLWRERRPDAPDGFTTVANWRQTGREVVFDGETYCWSKDREFRSFLDLPRRVACPVELATNLGPPKAIGPRGRRGRARAGRRRRRPACLLRRTAGGSCDAAGVHHRPVAVPRLRAAHPAAEFTVARDSNVRLRSGWFSERSACYLAAGRPVVAQDTGFGAVLPTGEGLFAFDTVDEATSPRSRRSRRTTSATAAPPRAIAGGVLRAETVLAALLDDLGL